MTFLEFIKELELWREERNLSVENQQLGLFTNVCEELGELAVAIRNNDIEGQIDAYLDILVFLVNSIKLSKDSSYDKIINTHINNEDLGLPNATVMFNTIGNVIENMYLENYNLDDITFYHNSIRDLITDFGYDFNKCLDEVMKALHSRKGKWDDSIKKFVKIDSDKYEPNYSLAKVN